MKIIMLRQCNVGGKSRNIGDEVEASAYEAHYLTGRNLARYSDDLGHAKSEGLTTRSVKKKLSKKNARD